MMHMTLYWGKELTLLFDSWKTDSWITYSFTLLFCFFLSLFYQHLEARRLYFKLRSSVASADAHCYPVVPPAPKAGPRPWWVRLASALLFGVNSAVSYLVMLAIMSCNGGVLLAVVAGLSVGYFLFRSGDLVDGDDTVAVGERNACACS